MRTSDFDYELPEELIAQRPAPERSSSRLFVVNRLAGSFQHRTFSEFVHFLRAGDLLVVNNSRVIRARLRGVNRSSGGEFEILLLTRNGPNDWWAMLRPGRRARPQTRIVLRNCNGQLTGYEAEVVAKNPEAHYRLAFSGPTDVAEALETIGEVPLPPYIKRVRGQNLNPDADRYQTVYAEVNGSVAAPTAGLHFTRPLLEQLSSHGTGIAQVTLHVGPGTFAPVKSEDLASHAMHEEEYQITQQVADAINAAKKGGRRVIAVGTTSLRVLESVAAAHEGNVVAGIGRTRLFVYPPFKFRMVDVLLTNFHLPRSTLLMLVSAFAAPGETRGRELVLSAYADAVQQRYRFFSYGDAMLLL